MGKRRATSLSPPERLLLEQWGAQLRNAVGEYPYLVGSVARGEDWRDVDVRLIVSNEGYAKLTEGRPYLVAALNLAISLWGQRATGLPIDFQLQAESYANEKHNGVRSALGLIQMADAPTKGTDEQ